MIECNINSSHGDVITQGGVITQNPQLLNRLSKLSNRDKQYAHILRCYMEAPSVIRGKTFVEADKDQRTKAKYHNTHSLSQSSKNNSVVGSAESKSVRNERLLAVNVESSVPGSTRSMGTRNGEIRSENNLSCRSDMASRFSCTDPSKSSAKTWHRLQEYTNDYFELLDIPGHFNTRGVYGQRAEVSPFTLKRTNSELSLSNLKSRFGYFERQATGFKWKIRSREKTDYFLPQSKPFELPTIEQNTSIGIQISPGRGQSIKQFKRTVQRNRKSVSGKPLNRVSRSQLPEENRKAKCANNRQKATEKKLASVSLRVDEIFDGVGALKVSEPLTGTKPKRMSVDVSVQTDGDYTDEETEYILF